MKPVKITLLVSWAALFLLGSIALAERLTLGEQLTNLTSYVPWGLWVAGYTYFIGLSAGAFLLSSLAYGFGMKSLERVGKLALFIAVVTLFMALLVILFDVGHSFRAWEIFARPNFSSIMTWMVWLYTSYFILLVAELSLALRPDLLQWKGQPGFKGLLAKVFLLGRSDASSASLQRDRRVLKVLAWIGIPLAVTFHGGVGALFATVAAQQLWHTSLYPILFLTGALASGGALLTAIVAFFWPKRDANWRDDVAFLGRITLALVLLDVLLEFAEYSIPAWYGVGSVRELQAMESIFFGQFSYVFWVFHVLLGVALPLVLLVVYARRPLFVGAAGALVAITFIAVRLNLVIPAFIEPQLQNLQSAYIDSRLSFGYLPSLFEWQLLLFVATLGAAFLYLGFRLLPLTTTVEQGSKS